MFSTMLPISVPNCDEACSWYMDIFGFRRIRSDQMTHRAANPDAPIFKVYGSKLQEVKCAWLACGNGVGFEVFQFIKPEYQKAEAFEYHRGGFFHIAITVADPEAMADRGGQGRRKENRGDGYSFRPYSVVRPRPMGKCSRVS